MDRFVWTSGLLEINETLVIQQRGVRIYDGEEKVGRWRTARPGPSSLSRPSAPSRAGLPGLPRAVGTRPALRTGSHFGPVPGGRGRWQLPSTLRNPL